MNYIKLFEEFKEDLKTFCSTYLAYLLDDDSFKFEIYYSYSYVIKDTITEPSKWGSNTRSKYKQIGDMRHNRRTNVFKLYRTITRKKTTYYGEEYNDTVTKYFNWAEIKDYFIPFVLMLDQQYDVINITLLMKDNTSLKSLRIGDIEKEFEIENIRDIFITIKQ